jgi:sulfite exporter TauE/SafE
VHALDADHIAAVSGLASSRRAGRATWRFCLHWATGHGLTLLLIGAAVLLLGMAIPSSLSALAESLVGAVLILIGLGVFRDLYRSRAHLHFHQHDALPPHAHWHRHEKDAPHDARAHRHGHRALLVGVLHGTAGSAPLLALLPAMTQGAPWVGMLYLLIFSLGVLCTMLIFGGVLSVLFARMAARLLFLLRGSVAAGSMLFGGWLLHGVL